LVPGTVSAQQGTLIRMVNSEQYFGRGLGMLTTSMGIAMIIGGYITPFTVKYYG